MTTELWLLVAAVLLGFVQIVLQAQSMNIQRGYRWNAGQRDEVLPPLTGAAGRLNRALRNFLGRRSCIPRRGCRIMCADYSDGGVGRRKVAAARARNGFHA